MSEETVNYIKYQKSFLDGYRNNIFSEERVDSNLELPFFESLAYDDGVNYAEYCKAVGCSLSVSNEQLLAEIDKCHTSALRRVNDGKGSK